MTTAGPGGSTACIPLGAGCSSSFRTPFLLGGIFDETEEKPIRRLSAAEQTPFLHDTLTDTSIEAMEKRNVYPRFCREISTISIPDLSLPSQMRRGEQKGHKGGCHRAVVAALLVTAGRHSRPPLRVPLRSAPVPAHPLVAALLGGLTSAASGLALQRPTGAFSGAPPDPGSAPRCSRGS